ncbi:MAG: hypothetical protein R6V12_02425 [Candidatus Hydrogenedentota bacterium]
MVIILLLIPMSAAADFEFEPDKTYEFIEKGDGPIEKRQRFGWIREVRPGGYLVEIDAPWDTKHVITIRDDMLESGPLLESEAMRERRIEEGWAARGFTKVTLADGQTAFVDTREVELAKRARQAGAAAESPEPEYIPPEALFALEQPPPVETPAEEVPEESFPWARRASQAALILVALVLAFAIAKMTVFAEG